MKNKIFNYRIIFIAVVSCFMFSSCVVEDDQIDFGTGTNFVGFSGSTYALNVEADGTAKSTGIPVSIIGPSVANVNNDITVTFQVDPSSTAVEGVNYTLESNTFTLSPQEAVDSFTGMLPITIITDGITPPLDVAPILNLSILEFSGDNNLVINDKTSTVTVTIGYACPFDVKNYEGTYAATTDEFGIYISDVVPFEVVAGPGDNQITLVNVSAHPEKYDVIVDIDPATGKLTVAKQPALNTNNLGYTYGEMRWEGSGTSGTAGGFCIGELSIKATYTVDAGSFGQYKTVFSKIANPE
jgi:hypothetical protein